MFGSPILDVALGMAFVFFIYSLFTTTLHEGIASVLGLRAKLLEKGITHMLNDESGNNFAQIFLNHPLIKCMGNGKSFLGLIHKGPSYISAENFSLALTDVMRTAQAGADAATQVTSYIDTAQKALGGANTAQKGSTSIGPETLNVIKTFWTEANGDFVSFRGGLEQWYNDAMDRVSGWYKRRTQFTMFIIGLLMAAAFNINTIEIAKKISTDKDARQELVNIAIQYSKTHTSDSLSALKKIDAETYSSLTEAGSLLGLGYTPETFQSVSVGSVASMVGGWLILALAVSLGAPFWFDLLQKIINLRGTGPSPDDNNN